jgi:hypothetical protein
VTTTGGLSFTTTVRVVDRVHGYTTGLWANALPAVTAGFTDLGEFVFLVTDFANGGSAINGDTAHFGAGQTQGGVIAFLSY